jgi:hypothetical protein
MRGKVAPNADACPTQLRLSGDDREGERRYRAAI